MSQKKKADVTTNAATKSEPKAKPEDAWPDPKKRLDAAPDPLFSPFRSFLICIALVTLPLALAWDLRYGAPEALIATYQPVVFEFAGEWLGELLIRTASDPVRLALVIWLAATFLYGLMQWVISFWDQRLAGRPDAGFAGLGRLCRWLGGRRMLGEVVLYLDAVAHYGGVRMLSPLRFGFSAFPMVGFLGTIVGLSGAIARLPDAVADKELLGPVLDELFVAFDTTFLGLLGAIICLVFVRSSESQIDEMSRKL